MKEKIRQVYDEIHAPEVLLGKVMEMKKEEFKQRRTVKYIAAAVLALALTVAASNGICYAATGETWLGKIKVLINGEERQQDIVWHREDDVIYGVMEMKTEEEVPLTVEVMTEDETADELEDTVVITVISEEDEESNVRDLTEE